MTGGKEQVEPILRQDLRRCSLSGFHHACARRLACHPVCRDYRVALTATTAQHPNIPTSALSEVLKHGSLGSIAWPSSVRCTANFLKPTDETMPLTVAAALPERLSDYLRPVGPLVTFGDGTVLLVSEREADAIVAAAREVSAAAAASRRDDVPSLTSPPILMSLCYAQQAYEAKAKGQAVHVPLAVVLSGKCAMRLPHAEALAAIQLFDGETSYGGEGCEVYDALKGLLRKGAGKGQTAAAGGSACITQLVEMRGKSSRMARSDLEKVRKELLS